jgi:hypothetical protein
MRGRALFLATQISDLLYAAPEAGIPLEPLAFSCIALAAFQLSVQVCRAWEGLK